jgi:hypothetical protein
VRCTSQFTELDQALAPEPRQVDDPGERVERLRRADVRCRLLAADVLLAGLQRQHEAAPAVDIDGLAGDPARHPPHVLIAHGEEAERRSAEVQPVAKRLTLSHADVDAEHPGASRMPSASGSALQTTSAPCSRAAAISGSRSSTAPRKFGWETNTALTPSSIASVQGEVGHAVGERDLLDRHPVAGAKACGASRSRADGRRAR